MFQNVLLPTGERLALDVTPPVSPRGLTAVFVHGLGSNRGGEKASYLEQTFLQQGHGFARFDLRGHGESDGRFAGLTMTRQLEDLEAVLSHLAAGRAGRPPAQILLVGSSLGALTVVWYTARGSRERASRGESSIISQVLIAPGFRLIERLLDALGETGRERWRREGTCRIQGPWFPFELDWEVVVDAAQYPHARLVEGTVLPTLIVHGTHDESAPFRESVEFAAACTASRPTLIAIEGGDHRLTAHKERLADEIVRFLR